MTTSHWEKSFYGRFMKLYGADKEAVKLWTSHGEVRYPGDMSGTYGLQTYVPAYTDRCMCGHYIKQNKVVSDNVDACIVGSCCVAKFMPTSRGQQKELHDIKVTARRKLRTYIKKHVQKIHARALLVYTIRQQRLRIVRKIQTINPRFGKYKNVQWVDVPTSYIIWCVDKDVWVDNDLAEYFKIRINQPQL